MFTSVKCLFCNEHTHTSEICMTRCKYVKECIGSTWYADDETCHLARNGAELEISLPQKSVSYSCPNSGNFVVISTFFLHMLNDYPDISRHNMTKHLQNPKFYFFESDPNTDKKH